MKEVVGVEPVEEAAKREWEQRQREKAEKRFGWIGSRQVPPKQPELVKPPVDSSGIARALDRMNRERLMLAMVRGTAG